jgi:BirA family transcriptional regulator, biotin operon repressor / biotin---[acetyl-CoA-carboxylase] ligase
LSFSADVATARYDGVDERALATSLGAPRVVALAEVGSTMDVAHALAAAGTPPGTIVLADAQTAGRGRAGRRWASHPGGGIWLTLVERPTDAAAIDVLSLRLGLATAAAVERFTDGTVRLKWPNDVYVEDRKLAGVLVEARWRDARPEWIAIGVGLNVVAPADVETAVGLRAGTARLAVLEALAPALREAASRRGPLDAAELAAFTRRDLALGRRIVQPVPGIVRGVTPTGALSVEDDAGGVVSVRHGSLVLADSHL